MRKLQELDAKDDMKLLQELARSHLHRMKVVNNTMSNAFSACIAMVLGLSFSVKVPRKVQGTICLLACSTFDYSL